MKLTRKLPDREGLWWCWQDGMCQARIHPIIWDGDGEPGYYVRAGHFLRVCVQYTHFAGPILQPDLPEPTRMEIAGRLYRPASPDKEKLAPHTLYLIPGERVPDSFTWRSLKIALEKIER